ncbi:MAG TPA: response regulator transcription factor [Streptosporangiales bacterium]
MNMTALIVDDHQLFRTSARLLLQAEGFDVIGEAVDGDSAVAAVDRLRPDVVVLDVQLPDTTGFDVARRLFAAGFAGRVVLVSSRRASEYGDQVDASGAAGFVAKDELSGPALRAALGEDES